MSVVLDSDVIVQILRGQDQTVTSLWEGLTGSGLSLLFSPVTAAEIWAGARSNELRSTAEFFNGLICAPIDYDIGCLAGDLMNQYSKSHGLKPGDALIAATAIRQEATLWTKNVKHYPMPQLTLL